jgi:hypothetical protein
MEAGTKDGCHWMATVGAHVARPVPAQKEPNFLGCGNRRFDRAYHDKGSRSYAQVVTHTSIPAVQAILPPGGLYDVQL